MISKLSGLTAALILCANTFTAQLSNYSFTQSAGSYGTPSTGTLIGSQLQDDDVNTVTLPFTFTFNGTPYTTMDVCANGYMSFNSLTGTEYPPISDNTTQQLISAFGTDIIMGIATTGIMTAGSNTITNCNLLTDFNVGDVLFDWNNDFGADPVITAINGSDIVLNINSSNSDNMYTVVNYGSLRAAVSGVAPNRVYELEYRNFCRFVADERINFKIKLYETSNKIEFVYGNMIASPDGGDVPEVGLKGLSQADFNSRTVNEPNIWSTSNAAVAISDYCDFSNTLAPSNGQTYAWQKTQCVTPTLIATQSPTFTCPGAVATLSVTGANSYTWTNGPSTAQYSVNPMVTTVYTVTGSNAECSSSITITHSIIPSPSVTVTQSSNQDCAGVTITLTAAGATTFTWTNGPLTAQYTVNPSSTTVYTVMGSNGGVCNGITMATHSVIPYPLVGIVQTTTICNGQTAVLTATGAAGYSWSNGQTTSQISVTPSVTTVYTLTGNNAQCTATTSITQNVDACLGLKENSLADNLSVYPNPFRNELNIKNNSDTEMTVTIADALGKTVYTASINGNASEMIDTGFLSNGLYFLKLSDKNASVTKKLVKN